MSRRRLEIALGLPVTVPFDDPGIKAIAVHKGTRWDVVIWGPGPGGQAWTTCGTSWQYTARTPEAAVSEAYQVLLQSYTWWPAGAVPVAP